MSPAVIFQLQLVLGYGPLSAGLALLPCAVAAAAGNGLGAALEARLGGRPALVAGLLVIAAGFGALALEGPGDGFAPIVTGLVVVGFGMGLGSPPAYNLLMAGVPAEEAGVGSAVNDAGQELGNALGVAVLGSVISAVYARALPDGAPAAAKHRHHHHHKAQKHSCNAKAGCAAKKEDKGAAPTEPSAK